MQSLLFEVKYCTGVGSVILIFKFLRIDELNLPPADSLIVTSHELLPKFRTMLLKALIRIRPCKTFNTKQCCTL